jgi:predicted MFS family arabinose efflux permease
VAEWIPPHQRSTAMGIINAGTAVGSVLPPPLIGIILLTAGWRFTYLYFKGGTALCVLSQAQLCAVQVQQFKSLAGQDKCERRSKCLIHLQNAAPEQARGGPDVRPSGKVERNAAHPRVCAASST